MDLGHVDGLPAGMLALALVAARPSLVRSEIRRRSKCAMAPKTLKTSSPAAEEVSIFLQGSEARSGPRANHARCAGAADPSAATAAALLRLRLLRLGQPRVRHHRRRNFIVVCGSDLLGFVEDAVLELFATRNGAGAPGADVDALSAFRITRVSTSKPIGPRASGATRSIFIRTGPNPALALGHRHDVGASAPYVRTGAVVSDEADARG